MLPSCRSPGVARIWSLPCTPEPSNLCGSGQVCSAAWLPTVSCLVSLGTAEGQSDHHFAPHLCDECHLGSLSETPCVDCTVTPCLHVAAILRNLPPSPSLSLSCCFCVRTAVRLQHGWQCLHELHALPFSGGRCLLTENGWAHPVSSTVGRHFQGAWTDLV